MQHSSTILTAFQKLENSFNTLNNSILSLNQSLLNCSPLAQGAVQKINKSSESTGLPKITDALADFAKDIGKDLVSNLRKSISNNLSKLGEDAAKGLGKKIVGQFKGMDFSAKGIGGTDAKIGKGIGGTAAKIGKGIGGTAAKIGKGIGDTAANIGKGIGDTAANIGKGIGGTAAKIGKGIGTVAKGLQRLSSGFSGVMKNSLKFLAANPWLLLAAVIIGLVVLLIKNWDTVKAAVLRFFASSWEALQKLGSFFASLFEQFLQCNLGIQAIVQIWDFFQGLINAFQVDGLTGAIEYIKESFFKCVAYVQELFTNLFSWEFWEAKLAELLGILGNGFSIVQSWFNKPNDLETINEVNKTPEPNLTPERKKSEKINLFSQSCSTQTKHTNNNKSIRIDKVEIAQVQDFDHFIFQLQQHTQIS
ncbi:MAG: hypothetical protein ACRCWI_08400 [Brevinema sp.]